MIRFGSVCSGIEAASVAWEALGWQAAWLAEIEPFPCSVLAHHYPSVANLGDMTKIPALVRAGTVDAPDVLVGGTPCQSFSIAGMRAGLSDPRGQLTYTFVELANAIDSVRAVRGEQPCVTVWENVCGVLSTKDNAFGCFLAGLAGESSALQPAGGKWTDAGCVFGPQRAIAWRVLDAQYFGLAQRRRRVFVVASARTGFDPTKILFESEGVRRDSPPSRNTREKTPSNAGRCLASGKPAFGTLTSSQVDKLWLGNQEAFTGDYHILEPVGPWWNGGNIADALTRTSDDQRMPDKGRFQAVVAQVVAFHPLQDPISSVEVTHALGCGSSTHGQSTIAIAYGIPVNWIGRAPENGGNSTEPHADRSPCLTAADRHGVAYGFRASGQDGFTPSEVSPPVCSTDGGGAGVPSVVYSFDSLASNSMKSPNPDSGCRETNIYKTLDTSIPEPSKNQGGIAILTPVPVGVLFGDDDVSLTITAGIGKNQGLSSGAKDDPIQHGVVFNYAVRRLLPVECERLQGFPDGYTDITHRGKPAADGPRYKALGNSMAVNVMAWIGGRIAAYLGRDCKV